MPRTEPDAGGRAEGHWFEPLADHMGPAYLRYSFTRGTEQEVDAVLDMARSVRERRADPVDDDWPAGLRVLDIGCGPGRHSLALARRGCEVVGVDISARFVKIGTQAARAQGLDRCRFVRADAATLLDTNPDLADSFDLVLSLCQGAFGVSGGPVGTIPRGPNDQQQGSEGPELDEPILGAMAQATDRGGVVVVSAFSSYFQVRHLEDGEDFDPNTAVNHEHTEVMDQDGRSMAAQLWTTCYTPRELRLLARTVGLDPLAVHGVSPGRYGPNRPALDHHEFVLVAGRSPN